MGTRRLALTRSFVAVFVALALFAIRDVEHGRAVHAQGGPQPAAGALASVSGASDAMRQIGLDDQTALAAMLRSTFDGTRELPFDLAPYRTNASARTRLVRSMLPILRRIVESQAFRDAYTTMRAERIAYEPPRAHTRQAEAPDAAERRQAERERARLEREAALPSDPNVLVATRLREFLALTEAMPWRAQLVSNERGRRVFVDTALEQKSREWKLCFRAGRPTVDAARTFVRRWLTDLERALTR